MKLFTLSLKRSDAPETEYEAATNMSLVVLIGASSVPPRRSYRVSERACELSGSEDITGALVAAEFGVVGSSEAPA